MRSLISIIIFCLFIHLNAKSQVYAKPNYSPTYEEIIDFYKSIDKTYKQATLEAIGETDIGKPLHLFCIKGGENVMKKKEKVRILINNGVQDLLSVFLRLFCQKHNR